MRRATVLRPDGYMSATDPEGGIIEADTLQCVHCGCHWQVTSDSRKVTGYCNRCCGPVCGPKCQACVPAEQQLQNMEQGRPLDHRSIKLGAFIPRAP